MVRSPGGDMLPIIFQTFSAQHLTWAIATVAGVLCGVRWSEYHAVGGGRGLATFALVAAAIIAGSKLLYLVEAQWFAADDYVPAALRGSLHGFRIPGGVALLAVLLPICAWVAALPLRIVGDLVAPVVAGAIALSRLGCFLNGCCFGTVSLLPWAVRFPEGSWVYWYHRTHEWVPEEAVASLPVHPLQLYFLLASLLILFGLILMHRGNLAAGRHFPIFVTLFGFSSLLIEMWRQNPLTLNHYVLACMALVGGTVLVAGPVVARAGWLVPTAIPSSKLERSRLGKGISR